MLIFNYIKASQFFPNYCPGVTNWINKARGKNGRGNHAAFTKGDLVKIEKGLVAMYNDCLKDIWIKAGSYHKKKKK